MSRQIQGPKDMPYALRNLVETSTAAWGSQEGGEIEDRDYGLIWVTSEVAQAAAEAGSEFPASMETYELVDRAVAGISKRGALVLFPAGTLPVVQAKVDGARRELPVAGFMARGVAYSAVKGGLPGNSGTFVIHPIVKLEDRLLDLCDLVMFKNPPGSAQDWEWAERTNHMVVSRSAPEVVRRNFQILLDPDGDQLGRFATACLLLMMEPGVTETTRVPAARKDNIGRSKPLEIRRITLRPMRYVKADRDSGGREYKHRWIVRGHWRNQWHPAEQEHRIRWIAPYIKGPEGAPMKTEPKVYVWNRL